jgi:hypothetical protein
MASGRAFEWFFKNPPHSGDLIGCGLASQCRQVQFVGHRIVREFHQPFSQVAGFRLRQSKYRVIVQNEQCSFSVAAWVLLRVRVSGGKRCARTSPAVRHFFAVLVAASVPAKNTL